jgi:hypothetical protein
MLSTAPTSARYKAFTPAQLEVLSLQTIPVGIPRVARQRSRLNDKSGGTSANRV